MTIAESGTVCIIPARGGSKRIPRKNIAPFVGVPLLARTIGVVRAARIVDRVVVSTDDDEIAAVAIGAGAEVPFRRPAALAEDHSTTREVVIDALGRVDPTGASAATWVVYPTAVLVGPEDLVDAAAQFETAGCDVAMSVVESPMPIERAWRRRADGTGEMAWPEHVDTRTQDLPDAFFDAGQFYVGTTQFWLRGRSIADADPLLIALPRERAVDLDTPEDWRLAEALYASRSSVPGD